MADARFFEGGKKCNFPLIFTGNEGGGGIKEKITLVRERKKNIMQGKEEEEET